MLGLSDKNFKAVTIKMLQQAIMNMIETNEKVSVLKEKVLGNK